MAYKKLYRSRKDKMIAGVCGGIAEYFNIDVVWVRLIAILLLLAEGVGFILYIVAWIIVPENPSQKETKKTFPEKVSHRIKKEIEEDKKKEDKKRQEKARAEKTASKIQKKNEDDEIEDELEKGKSIFLPVLLILVGTFFLLRRIFVWIDLNLIWPILVIAFGLHLILKRKR